MRVRSSPGDRLMRLFCLALMFACVPQHAASASPDCAGAPVLATDGTLLHVGSFDGASRVEPGLCSPNDGTHQWVQVVPQDSELEWVLEVFSPFGDPTLTVFERCPENGGLFVDCASGTDRRATVVVSDVSISSFLVRVSAPAGVVGPYELRVFQEGDAPCCLPDGACLTMLVSECRAVGGVHGDIGATCGSCAPGNWSGDNSIRGALR